LVAGLYALPYIAKAQVASPDTIQIDRVEAYRSVIEAGDQLYLCSYEIEYGSNPADAIDQTYLFRLMNSGTELMAATAYPYQDSGYDVGVVGIYFSSAEVSYLGMGWGDATGYSLQLVGNPTVIWAAGTPPQVNYPTFDLWYNDGASSDRLTLRLRVMAQLIENDWGTVNLIEGPAGEQTFTEYGEEYFTNSIPNLKVACPKLFEARLISAGFGDHTLVISDYYVSGANTSTPCYTGNQLAQTWTAGHTYTIDSVNLKIGVTGTPVADVTVSICPYVAGTIAGTPVATGTITATEAPDDLYGDWYEVGLGAGGALTRDSVYVILWTPTGGSGTTNITWFYGSGYAGGTAYQDIGAGLVNMGVSDFQFICKSSDTFEMSRSIEMSERLVGTAFDLTDAAEATGISRMWMSGVMWVILMVVCAYFGARISQSSKPVLPIIMFMIPIGALAGFLYYWVAGVAMFAFIMVWIWAFAWDKSSA